MSVPLFVNCFKGLLPVHNVPHAEHVHVRVDQPRPHLTTDTLCVGICNKHTALMEVHRSDLYTQLSPVQQQYSYSVYKHATTPLLYFHGVPTRAYYYSKFLNERVAGQCNRMFYKYWYVVELSQTCAQTTYCVDSHVDRNCLETMLVTHLCLLQVSV